MNNKTLWGVVAFIVYAIAIPLGFLEILKRASLSHGISLDDVTLQFAVFGTIFGAAAKLAWLSIQSKRPIMQIPFWAFVYIWLGLAPLYQFSTGRLPWDVYKPEWYNSFAYLVVAIGLFSYELGRLFWRSRKRVAMVQKDDTVSSAKLWSFALLSIALVLYIGFFVIGPIAIMSTRSELASVFMGDSQESTSKLFYYTLLRVPIYAVILTLAWLFALKRHRTIRRYWLLTSITIPFFFFANFPTSIPRAWLGGVVISLLVVLIIRLEPKNLMPYVMTLIVGLTVLYPLLGYTRRPDMLSESDLAEAVIASYSAGSFDAFQQIVNTIYYVDRAGIEWGRQFLGPLLFWVPRSLWPAKPIGSGAYVADRLNISFLNVSSPLWAEGYLNFGFIGVIGLFFLFGRISARLEYEFNSRSTGVGFEGLLLAFLAGYQMFLLRGDLLWSAATITPFLVIVYALTTRFRFKLR